MVSFRNAVDPKFDHGVKIMGRMDEMSQWSNHGRPRNQPLVYIW